MRKVKRILSLFLAIALTLTMFSAVSAPTVEAKTKMKTKTISLTMYVGEKCQLGHDGLTSEGHLSSKAKTSNKQVVKLSNRKLPTKSYRATLTAKKAGKANITYNMFYFTKKDKKVDCKVKVKITVKKKAPALIYDENYTLVIDDEDAEDDEDELLCFDVKPKQTKEFKSFRDSHVIGGYGRKTTLKVDGKTVDTTACWSDCGIRFHNLDDNFVYYDVYRVTGDTKLNEYDCIGCVLTKIDTVLEINKDKTELFVNDKPTTEPSDAVGVYNENGEELICTEDELKNIEGTKVSMTSSPNYFYSNGECAYYKVGDIIKVRRVGELPTAKEMKAYIQEHPERFSVEIKTTSVKCVPCCTRYFPVYVRCSHGNWLFNWNTLKY